MYHNMYYLIVLMLYSVTQMGGDGFYTSSPMPGAGAGGVVNVGALSNGSVDYGESDDELRREDIMFPGDVSHMGNYGNTCFLYLYFFSFYLKVVAFHLLRKVI